MQLAQEANRYLDEKAPWKSIKENESAAASSLYTAIGVISALKTVFYPFLPFSSQKVHEYLGFSGRVEDGGWKMAIPESGQKLNPPQVLFTKLDESVIADEQQRMGLG
jgi:methionyl-tRNA synthetase